MQLGACAVCILQELLLQKTNCETAGDDINVSRGGTLFTSLMLSFYVSSSLPRWHPSAHPVQPRIPAVSSPPPPPLPPPVPAFPCACSAGRRQRRRGHNTGH